MRGGRSSRRHCRCRSPSAPRGVPDRFQLVYSRRTRLIPITPRNSLIPTRPVPALLWVDYTDDKSIASAAGPLRLRSTCSYRHARSAGLSQRTPRPRPAERDACNPLCIPKEVLHTRTRERLLEHFLSVVLRPGRMPPLTRQSDFAPFIRGPDRYGFEMPDWPREIGLISRFSVYFTPMRSTSSGRRASAGDVDAAADDL